MARCSRGGARAWDDVVMIQWIRVEGVTDGSSNSHVMSRHYGMYLAIESIAAGAAHTLALSKGGRVFAWGAGSDGQCEGHAGNLIPSSVGSKAKVTPKIDEPAEGGQNMPYVNSKVAMAVTMEEEELSKALSMSQITNVTPPLPEPKAEKIVSI